MGDKNQLQYVRDHINELAGPYLEVGSRNYGSTQDLRSIVPPGQTYVGLDMTEGDGVDLVLDLTEEFDGIDERLGGRRFGTIFCLSVMEHCERPFRMAEAVSRLLRPGGKLCISVPYAWKFHGYPSDYWRFTHMGVMKLFPKLDFNLAEAMVSGEDYGDTRAMDDEIGRITFGCKGHWRRGRYLRGIAAGALRMLSKIGLLRWLAGHRYVMPPTMITMIGRRE